VFTGTAVQLVGTFAGSSVTTSGPTGTVKVGSETHTHSVTAKGSVSQPTFTGTAGTTEKANK